MQVVVDIPESVVQELQKEHIDPARAAIEGLAVDGYLCGRLTRGQIAEILGMSFHEAERWFVEKGLRRNYSIQELEEDRKALARLFPE